MQNASTHMKTTAITGITGQVGRQVADLLLDGDEGRAGTPPARVRAVLRDEGKAPPWSARGCEIACAAMDDAAALARAFDAVDAVFVLLPPVFDPTPGFAETRRHVAAIADALATARPRQVVCLSTIGVQAAPENLLTQLQIMERAIGALDLPSFAFLRAAWFMENAAWDVPMARAQGVMPSFLQPLDRAFPMVATADVARVAATLLQDEGRRGRHIVELEGPTRVTPRELAKAMGEALGREVVPEAVPRGTWERLFRDQGMRHPLPRMRMLDGFNEGWIDFERAPGCEVAKGGKRVEQVMRALVEATRQRCGMSFAE